MTATKHNEKNPKVKRTAIGIVVGCVLVVAAIAGYRAYKTHQEHERLEAEAKAGPHVAVTTAKRSPPTRELNLVGEALPYASVTLYAKVSGYLKTLKVDKGDKVKKDQLLAVIESPEVDKDYQGALADSNNKKSIAGRMNQLRARNLVSAQEADQAQSDADVARAKLESLAVQKGYETLRAPFDGTVTARFTDPGALVQNAANSQTSAQPVVTVSQVDKLRVYVYVDQRDASYIKVGGSAAITLAERPALDVKATVTRLSGELDPKTKLLLTEVDIDNVKSELVPGSFVQVNLVLHIPAELELPVQALVIQEGKDKLAIVDKDDTVHYREVRVGENDGQQFAVLSGLEEGERVALNVGNNLPDGSHIRPSEDKKDDKKSAGDKPAEVKAAEGKPADGKANDEKKGEDHKVDAAPAEKAAEPASSAPAKPKDEKPKETDK